LRLPNLSFPLMQQTLIQYDRALDSCKDIFMKKLHDYGTAWRILRTSSLTDQLFIKAQRIRTIQENGKSEVGEGIYEEFQGIVNYAVMALIQLDLKPSDDKDMPADKVSALYDAYASSIRTLMSKKNQDYGEAWRDMRISSLTDLILMKILRVKQIEDNLGKTLISEGIDANYMDMANYALFALIKLNEESESLN
jgi:hypothetical protein